MIDIPNDNQWLDGAEIHIYDLDDNEMTLAVAHWRQPDGEFILRLFNNETGDYLWTMKGQEYREHFDPKEYD